MDWGSLTATLCLRTVKTNKTATEEILAAFQLVTRMIRDVMRGSLKKHTHSWPCPRWKLRQLRGNVHGADLKCWIKGALAKMPVVSSLWIR